MDSRIRSLLVADFDALTTKSMDLIDESDPRRAMIAGMLATCMHLLGEVPADAPISEPERPRRDLRREMAGPLPSVRREAPFVEQPAPEYGRYETYEAESERVPCPDCGGPIGGHPIDRKLPWRGELASHVACNQDRVYCWTQRERGPMTAEEAGLNGAV